MNKTFAISLVALASIAASSYFSPHYTLHRLQSAAVAGDLALISDHVDSAALRENLIQTRRASIKEKMDRFHIKEGGFLSNVVTGLNDGVSGMIADAMVKPENIAMMFRWGQPHLPVSSELQVLDVPAPPEGGARPMTVTYRSWSTAVARAKGTETEGDFVFTRTGLWGWKLSGMELAP